MATTENIYQLRTSAVQAQLAKTEALVCTSPSTIRYLTGFVCLVPSERDGIAVITKSHVYLIHSSFSPLPDNADWLKRYVGTSPDNLLTHLTDICRLDKCSTLIIDTETMTVNEHEALQKLTLQLQMLTKTSLHQFLHTQRAHKDATEIALIRRASQITNQAVSAVFALLRPGITELEVKRLLEHSMENAGATGMAFPSIIAFGSNSALPHHQPDDTRLGENTTVLIDVGAQVEGYNADMTRTIWFGSRPNEKFLQIENLVHSAYAAALSVLQGSQSQNKPITLQTVDQAARALIAEAGFGPQFNHTTGHGLGLDIHEHPSVNWKSEVVVKPQLVVTVEPGIYLAGEFGYRYENTVVITEDTAVELTTL